MNMLKKWTQAQKLVKLGKLRDLEKKAEAILHEEILKDKPDEDILKKLFYHQKRIKDARNYINLGLIRTDKKFNNVISELILILNVDLSEDENADS